MKAFLFHEEEMLLSSEGIRKLIGFSGRAKKTTADQSVASSHTVLVEDVGKGVLDLLAVRIKVEDVAHHGTQPVIREFLNNL